MDTGDGNVIVSYKIYLIQPSTSEPEIRRFGISPSLLSYNTFINKLVEVFPRLGEKLYSIYWKDEEGDEVVVSSPEEFQIAHASMKTDVKKFIVRVESSPAENRSTASHPNIFCDGCESAIQGFRYKCLFCSNYDLCETCEKAKIHAEHPMLRITDPYLFKRGHLQKMIHTVESFVSRERHRDRKHHHEAEDAYSESHKKPKKCDRRESADTDESEDGCHRKHSHSHKKMKKGKCPYSQMMSDVFTYLYPKDIHVKGSQGWTEERPETKAEESSHGKYLRCVGMTLQKFLDPLGVEVDFEVRPNVGKKDEMKEERNEEKKKEEKNEEKKKEEKNEEKKKEEQENGTPPPTPSAPKLPSNQKEVRFADSPEVMLQKMDEIAKLLAKQTMNGGSSGSSKNGDDGWVEFEELERACEEPRSNGSASATPKVPQQQEKPSGEQKQPTGTSSQPLYPNLNPEQFPTDPVVRSALEQMLAMGFTNEGNWLGRLLEAKQGNISHALEALDPRSKDSNQNF